MLTEESQHRAFGRAAGSQVLVIGGSIAGMLAARVLSDHFDWVTIIERDRLPDAAEPRKGTPQARHIHALLMRGRDIVEGLFPGICQELIDAGSVVLDIGSDVKWLTPAGWGVNFKSDLISLSFSRDMLELTLRRRLKNLRNVRFLEGCEVSELISDSTGSAISGAQIRFRNDEGKLEEKSIRAGLVVDASGRGSRLSQWLAALGYGAPKETVVNAHLGYASRLYTPSPDFKPGWKALILQAAPPENTRAGLIFPMEGNRWIVTLGGGDGDYPPTDEEGFAAFMRSLPTPDLYEAVKRAVPISPIYGSRSTENRLRHFDSLSRWPERLLVMGDGVCAFNPVYGQGMTAAALGALTLEHCLLAHRRRVPDGDLTGMARHFLRQLARVNQAPWLLATSADYRYRRTEGAAPDRITKFMHWYVDRVLQLSTKGTRVRRRFLEVQQMLKTPTSLFHPAILIRIVWNALTSSDRPEQPRIFKPKIEVRAKADKPIDAL